MDGLVQTVGDGVSGVVGGSLDFIGRALSGILDALVRAVPGGAPVLAAAFVAVVGGGWLLLKR